MDITCGGHAPVLGALFHKPGAIARHDAVAWGYGREPTGAASRFTSQQTEVLGIDLEARARGRRAHEPRATSPRVKVLCAVAGSTPRLLDMVGIRSPITIHPAIRN